MSELAKHRICAVHITDRVEKAVTVQNILTEYSSIIRTRVGFHDVDVDYCSKNGLIILELLDDEAKAEELKNQLNNLTGVEVKNIVFDHP